MKLLLCGNAPYVGTGYGVQAELLLPRLADTFGVENVAMACNYGLQGTAQRWNGIRLYPSGLTPYSDDVMPAHAEHFFDGQPGWVLTLFDVWVLSNPAWQELNVASWCPVDHLPLPPGVLSWFTTTGAQPIAMSRYGEAAFDAEQLDPLYVPLAIDSTRFNNRPGARERLGIPDSAFVAGMVAANKGKWPPRKAFAESFAAFSRFHSTHPDSYLFVFAERLGLMDGLNLEHLARMCGIEDAVKFADPYTVMVGATTEQLADVYTAIDVLLAPSYGEGFCVPLIEAQACGTAVIANNFAAQPELVANGYLVSGQPFANMHQLAWYQVPNIEEIVHYLNVCYARTDREKVADAARGREFAMTYDINRVYATHWSPALKFLEEHIGRK